MRGPNFLINSSSSNKTEILLVTQQTLYLRYNTLSAFKTTYKFKVYSTTWTNNQDTWLKYENNN